MYASTVNIALLIKLFFTVVFRCHFQLNAANKKEKQEKIFHLKFKDEMKWKLQ